MRKVIRYENIDICACMIIIKILYIISVALLLPDTNMLWSFDKEVVYSNFSFELIPFLSGLYIFYKSYYKNNPYTYCLTLFFIIFFIPINSGLVLSNNRIDYYLLVNIFALLLMYLIKRMAVFSHYSQTEVEDVNDEFFDFFSRIKLVWTIRIVMIFVCVFTLLYVYNYNHFNFSILFDEMYSVRADYAQYAEDIQGTSASYISLIITKTSSWLLPIYLYYSLMGKKVFDTLICIFTFIANFSVEMQKVSLFIIAVVVFIVIIQKRGKLSLASKYLIFGFVFLYSMSIIEYYINGESIVFSNFLRRITYVPSYLSNIYYCFFVDNSKIWLTQDAFIIQWFTRYIIHRPYSGSTVSVISDNVFSGKLPSPNTGIFAEAYAQMGIIGVIVFPFINSLVIKYVKKSSEIFGIGAPFIVLSKVCFTFINNFTLATSTIIGLLFYVLISNIVKKLNEKEI